MKPFRAFVVGTDPGTSSLDLLLLVDGRVHDQARLTPDELRAEPARLSALLQRWSPLDLIAGPSGYGLPLVRAEGFPVPSISEVGKSSSPRRAQPFARCSASRFG